MSAIKLSVEDVDRGQNALFTDRHGLIVDSVLLDVLQVCLAQISLALHQVRLD